MTGITVRSARPGDWPRAIRFACTVFELGGDLEQRELDRGIRAASGQLADALNLRTIEFGHIGAGNHARRDHQTNTDGGDCAAELGVSMATALLAIALDSQPQLFLLCSHA